MKFTEGQLNVAFFDNSWDCECDSKRCKEDHRACHICGKTMSWGHYEELNFKDDSIYKWTISLVTPISKGGLYEIDNFIAVHPKCKKIEPKLNK